MCLWPCLHASHVSETHLTKAHQEKYHRACAFQINILTMTIANQSN